MKTETCTFPEDRREPGVYNARRMRILLVATKTPWPPIDGGRLVLLNTIDGLRDAGHRVTLIAPVDQRYLDVDLVRRNLEGRCEAHLPPAATRGALRSLMQAEMSRTPVTIIRHSLEPVRRMVERLISDQRFDVVHAEQQQSFAGSEPARRAGIPVVLRAQNVESALWTFASRYRSPFLKLFFRREAAKLAVWERGCVRQADATIALTRFDAEALRNLAGPEARVETVEAPFVGHIEAERTSLEGDPAVVILASRKWLPNRDAVWRFVGETWPRVHQVLPSARLHVFGISESIDRSPGVMWHPAPEESSDAFPSGAVVAIPSRHPTGVPMKGLEAWARGLPVVGSPEAAEQLEAEDGREMLVASGPEHFARAMVMLHENLGLWDRLIEGGREALKQRHDPEKVVAKLEDVYRQAVSATRIGPQADS